MSIIIKKSSDIKPSEITPKSIYLNRRKFMQHTISSSLLLSLDSMLPAWASTSAKTEWPDLIKSPYSTSDKANSFEEITTYNNFYEFGTSKKDPHKNATAFDPKPWSITVEGECDKPGVFDLEDFIKPSALEERIYRLRCVEGWSMVIPWQGFPLSELIRRVEPTGDAKFVRFETVMRPAEMVGQRAPIVRWPYVEGLRMDEAMHPLTLLATGVYGMDLPNQNGAPLRLVVPWKYGFKSVKSIVSISFVEEMPMNTWQIMNAGEYGFYANVNPEVDHPRWSQARERRLPGLFRNFDTLPFNGYGDQVAGLYAGMDLRRWK